MDSKLKIKKYFIVISAIFALLPCLTFAAEITFEGKNQEIAVGEQFEVGVFINTDNEEINAVEGKIIFPQDLLGIEILNDGNSIINFWIEKPKSTSESQIAFSGIVPGGYNDSQGLIFSITFLAKKEGDGAIEFSGVKALRNDGKGTEAPLTISNFQFLISKQVPVTQITIPKTEDRNPPEEFTPQIAADPVIFEGKWFLVFATQDKGSGIDRYEVQESRKQKIENRRWAVAESPYVLKDQKLKSYVYVKAVDKAGNERITMLLPQNPPKWYENYFILGIIILIAVGYAIRILWQRFTKSR